MVVHEPPIVSILPDAAAWQALVQTVHKAYVAQGAPAAIRLFMGSLTGIDPPTPATGPGPGAGPNLNFFFAREYLPISSYALDLERSVRNQVPIVVATARGVPLELLDLYDDWSQSDDSAPLLLIRPDQHVAWRGATAAPPAAQAIIARVMGC